MLPKSEKPPHVAAWEAEMPYAPLVLRVAKRGSHTRAARTPIPEHKTPSNIGRNNFRPAGRQGSSNQWRPLPTSHRLTDGTDAELVWWRGWTPHKTVQGSAVGPAEESSGSNSGLRVLQILVRAQRESMLNQARPHQLIAQSHVSSLMKSQLSTVLSVCNQHQTVRAHSSLSPVTPEEVKHSRRINLMNHLGHLLWVIHDSKPESIPTNN